MDFLEVRLSAARPAGHWLRFFDAELPLGVFHYEPWSELPLRGLYRDHIAPLLEGYQAP